MSRHRQCRGKYAYHDWQGGKRCVRCHAPLPKASERPADDPYVDGYNAFGMGMTQNTHAAGTEKHALWDQVFEDARTDRIRERMKKRTA